MGGSRITVPGYVGDMGLGFDPVVRRGLKFLNFFGESADKTGRNLAPGGAAATVLGSPVLQTNGVQFTPAGTLLDTGILQSADFTFFTIFNCPTLSQILLLSNFNGPRQSGSGTTQGVVLRTQPGSNSMTLNFSVNTINGNTSTQRTVALGGLQANTNYLLAARFKSGQKMDFQILNKALSAEKTTDMGDPADLGAKLRIGGSYQPDLTNAGIHRMSALHNIALTDDEISKAGAQWSAWANAVGLAL
ncbi:TPA: hypothetical protein ACQ8S2_003999 [Klebsiella pneumoniae]|uniref:hypothetical protein n=1 Tax=Klebsiella/Raoultella group TaxID=2890311 RepID=UPI00065F820B|nr:MULTISPECIES: hypothetical protein [Klebsiella/Raoultella group]MCS5943613.1 hypothetical protein [Klebsiella pneumoniae subsp. pneumoniae]MDW1422711.1 hypothetical protein [Klebsiella pneumoniae]VAN95005.1 Uncharacterised protein [Klebsiella pneumoniae]VAO68425.1 Uncharacterised protein [Klebsiella pneumoniae]HBV6965979.1 hypothetical protein [Klebsiella pneumoniae]